MIYEHLSPDTRMLLDVYEDECWKFGMARDDQNRKSLELAREELLEALRSDFIAAMMDNDETVSVSGV